MDRGKRGSISGPAGASAMNKFKSKAPVGKWPTLKEQDEMDMQRKQKYGGEMIAPTLQKDERSLMIDPNLLVGPLYEPTSQQDQIKTQLTDITDKLHKTLGAFDDIVDYEEPEDPLVKMMKNKIHDMGDVETKTHFAKFLHQYEDMAVEVSNAHKDRDEMLFQLADWFTTDHVDLDDIKSSFDESDEDHLKDSYFETVTNFEKLKTLQMQIAKASSKGKPTRQLEITKMALEKDVVDKFKVMKDMSMQTMKLKISDDAPWKYAAQEIVSMLKNVRTENSAELEAIAKNMKDMVDQLEKQALTIKCLSTELREKKEIVTKLTDENGDLSQDVAVLRARYIRYEKDLETAKQLIKSLHKEQKELSTEKGTPSDQLIVPSFGKELAESISKVLKKFDEPELDPVRLSSDPALLRTQLRDYQEALECIRSEYSRANEDIEELQAELEEKKIYIENMEEENDKFMRDLRKLRQERKQSIAAGFVPPSGGDAIHRCEHCKCHVTEEAIEDEIEELKREVEKWQSKCEYFKKSLADTELRLSDAYKEISELRKNMDIHENILKETPMAKVPKEKEITEPEEKEKKEPVKEPKNQEPKIKPKPKREIRARYLDTKSQDKKPALPPIDKELQGKKFQDKKPALPPIDKELQGKKSQDRKPAALPAIDKELQEMTKDTQLHESMSKQSREMKLYRVGDLQGKLNMLVHEIMEFVSEVGRMLHVEKDDDKKIQSMKSYAFDQSGAPKKPARDMESIKDQEAKQKKSQVIFSGQHAVSKLREAFDMLSNSLELGHEEFESIYRSFKVSQQRHTIKRQIIHGALPLTALQEFDQSIQAASNKDQTNELLNAYYNISYGGGAGMQLQANKPRSIYRKTSSLSTVSSETNAEAESKLKETINVLSMQRSRSNLDDTGDMSVGLSGGSMFGTGILASKRSQTFFGNIPEHLRRESIEVGNKQEVKIAKAVVPRKGLIQLTSSDEPAQSVLGVGGVKRQTRSSSTTESQPFTPKGLIRRKSMLKYIEAGQKLLEESESIKTQEEEMTKSLGEYTILDLQSKILEMTDTGSQKKRPFGMMSAPKTPLPDVKKTPARPKGNKGVTLPNINQLKIF